MTSFIYHIPWVFYEAYHQCIDKFLEIMTMLYFVEEIREIEHDE